MNDFTSQKRALLYDHLRRNLEGEVRFDFPTRTLYSTDASIFQIEPLGVVIPRTQEDLATAVRIALETETPIVPRGGGTSLSGQSIGPGLVIDCSKFLNQIGPVDVAGKRVTVQPGVVLDHLNRALAVHGLQFGPDVATANRATFGGMIGNNSAGARSIVYGKTVDHVLSLKTVLADGSSTEFDRRGFAKDAATFAATAAREVLRITSQHRPEIVRRFPNIVRRVSGYNLRDLLSTDGGTLGKSVLPILIGSEGTLAFTLEAELNLVPRPKHRGLLVPHFDSLGASLDALAACLEFLPSAVELMDSMLIDLALKQRSLKHMMGAIQGHPAALLMVEFSSDDVGEVRDRVEKLQHRLKEIPGLTAAVPAIDPTLRDPVWNLRRAAMPLLYGMPGDGKPITFVEDCAVDPARLPEFAARFRETLRRHGTDGCFYGHASVGCLHIRPVLNLKDQDDVRRMRTIMEEVTDLVLAFGGSLSGEHGDGLVRSEWNRKMFGNEVYEAFQRVKQAFDPRNLFNPGKVVNAPPMTENLRYGADDRPAVVETVLDYSKQGGFLPSIELCNGAGVCRKTQGGAMCPSYRATHDEHDSTRGRANALRRALTHPELSKRRQAPLAERWLLDVMDLCLSCKACKAECPSNVDLAKLKAEFLNAYYGRRMRPLGHYLAGNIHRLNRVGAPFAGLLNWINQHSFARWIMEKVAGIDRRRSLPRLHSNHVRKWFAERPKPTSPGSRRVLLFDDCFTTYNEPAIGQAAVEVLENLGCRVELVNPLCCGRGLLSKGFLKEARTLAQTQIPVLARLVEDGTPILGLEPSCVLTLADEWPELVPGPMADRVAASVHLAESWIGSELGEQFPRPSAPPSTPQRCLFHGHCHQRALCGVKGTSEALQRVPHLDVVTLDSGCCGMAGSFGYEKSHFDLSVQIANLDLIPRIQAEPDAVIVATGTSCRHQIHDLTGRIALHPIQLLAEAVKPSG